MNFTFHLEKIFHWIPGREEGTEISEEPYSKGPPLKTVPSLQRRRMSPATKALFYTAMHCLPESGPEPITVFASRHGEIGKTLKLLEQIANKELISPMGFSLSVHNTASGFFSIISGNKEPSVSIAGGSETFQSGWLEAVSRLYTSKGQPVLYVYGEEIAPDIYRKFIPEKESNLGIAFLLQKESPPSQPKCIVRLGEGGGNDRLMREDWLGWYGSSEKKYKCELGNHYWHWEKSS